MQESVKLIGKYVEGKSGATRRGIVEHLRRKLKARLAALGEEVEFLARMEQDEGLAELEALLYNYGGSTYALSGDMVGAGSIENYFCPIHVGDRVGQCDQVLVWHQVDEQYGYGEAVCSVHGVVDVP